MDLALSELRNIRESNLRASRHVINLWKSIVSKNVHKLGNEKWGILEQVFIAALDVSDEGIASPCLDLLRKKFPRSKRVTRLIGMFLESQQRFGEARDVYTKIIESDPTNTLARKRLIAILKAQDQIPEAIEELNKYLNIFMADTESWSELADLYLSQCDYKHSAFCIEELILNNPHNHLLHQRLAEIKYSEGGVENFKLSRSYFVHTCILNPLNLRAVYGLLLVTTTLIDLNLKSGNHNFENSRKSIPTSLLNNSLMQPNYLTQVDSGNYQCKNGQLASWASKQIDFIYAKAEVERPLLKSNKTFSKLALSENVDSNPSKESVKRRDKETEFDKLCDKLETLKTAANLQELPSKK